MLVLLYFFLLSLVCFSSSTQKKKKKSMFGEKWVRKSEDLFRTSPFPEKWRRLGFT